jgi:hypothetical protein
LLKKYENEIKKKITKLKEKKRKMKKMYELIKKKEAEVILMQTGWQDHIWGT